MKSCHFISEETMVALQEGLEEVEKEQNWNKVETKLEKKLLKLSAGSFCPKCRPKVLGLLDESDSVI